MRLMGLQAQVRRRKRRTANSEHGFPRYPTLVLEVEKVRPEQIWVCDIMYIPDQGIQYAATAYAQVLQDVQVQISMADRGEAWQNGYTERLMRTATTCPGPLNGELRNT
jgi:transposase InsO family protein